MAIGTTGCPAYDPAERTAYGYRPSLAAGIIFCILFGLSMFIHIFQAARSRAWWNLVFTVGSLCELLGWAARTWSYACPYSPDAFLMQICTLIIAPTFFTAGIYVVLGRMIHIAGPGVSPIGPKWYLWIFCTVDVISLVVQAVGGGWAAVAFQQTPPGDTKTGTNIMVAGIDFQLGSVIIFSVLFFNVLYLAAVKRRLPTFKNDKNMKILVAATTFAIVLIIMRSIYRTVELAQGWTGHIIETERYFLALDGAAMAAVTITFNIFHPGMLLNRVVAKVDVADTDKAEHDEKISPMHDSPVMVTA